MPIPITILGFVAGTMTTIAFLPQVIKTLREKRAKDISLGFAFLNVGAAVLWLTYGILIQNWPLIIPITGGLSLGLATLVLKLRY